MLKVECESCKAPYQIDERRVPPAGLKMRCPKCGHSFLVSNPDAPPGAAPVALATAAAPPARAASPAAPPSPAAGPPTAPPALGKKTMMGVAPPVPTASKGAPPPFVAASAVGPPLPPARQALPSDFPAALGGLDEPDLPVISVGLPAALPVKPRSPLAPAHPPRPAVPALPPAPVRAPGGEIDLDLDLPALPSDLPVVAADLPAAKGAAPPIRRAPPPPPAAGGSFEIDLPSPAAAIALPVAKGARPLGLDDLPVVAGAGLPSVAGVGLPTVVSGGAGAHLPVVVSHGASLPSLASSVGLPAVSASLPAVSTGLPSLAASLPSPAGLLPSPAAILPARAEVLPVAHTGFGELELPGAPSHEGRPASSGQPHDLAAPGFGEIELPPEGAPSRPVKGAPSLGPGPRRSAQPNSADFGDLEFAEQPSSSPRTSVNAPRGTAGGGMTFGELDFGGEDSAPAAEASIGIDASVSPPQALPPAGPAPQAAATAPLSVRPPANRSRERPVAEPKKRSLGASVAASVLVLAILGGAGLQVTPYGAYGYLVIGDLVKEKAYAAATASTLAGADKTQGSDTYDDAKSAVDATVAAHVGNPRIKALTAIAAAVDYATTVRFGPDVDRGSRAKPLMGELAGLTDVRYLDVALAAQMVEAGEVDRGRKALDAAGRRYPGDPIQRDVALLRGGLELGVGDGAAAVVAFQQAAALGNDARAHFGLARGYDRLGDAVNARKEIDATLALSPLHPGALTLRARRKSATVDDASALKDLAMVIDGPARAKASPTELSRAYAARAWVLLERGAASEAREAFGQAVKLDPRNVAALNGEGRLLLNEGRYTEALSRFDTALQFDPASPDSIANDAEAKIALERLADAKQQLIDAKARFPKSIPILLLLGKAEQHLGNNDAAEQDLRAAMSLSDPSRSDAVLPYVALSELLSVRGHIADARTVLDDARKRLPPSAELDRAVGEVNEAQGEYDSAIAQYRASLAKDPRNVATHFRLAIVLRRIRRFDEAAAELDRVAAVDKDYPGLSLERGLLFEESGDVDKAIEQFKTALAKAPDDPDLQLRVGSSYVVIGRPDDALPMLRRVLEKRPSSAEAHHYIGRALMLKGPSEQVDALRYLKRAVDLDPNRAEFHVYLAWAANDAQPAQLELARDEIDRALALDKQNPEAYWQRGVLERMEGAVEDSVKDEKRALELRPSRYEAHATLAQCYEDKNDDSAALAEWARALAAEGKEPSADGSIPHAYWKYRYGKLLLDHGQSAAALAQLLPAVAATEKDTGQRPGWLGPLEFLTAEALRKSGRRADALEHYRRFLEIAPVNSPDRADAQHFVAELKPRN